MTRPSSLLTNETRFGDDAGSARFECGEVVLNGVRAVALSAIIMCAGGFVFPVVIAALQAGAGQARDTVSSLSNVAMYTGTTIGVGRGRRTAWRFASQALTVGAEVGAASGDASFDDGSAAALTGLAFTAKDLGEPQIGTTVAFGVDIVAVG